MKNSRSTDSIRLLALLSLGEVGHHVDLSNQPELKTVILDAFSSSSEEVPPTSPTRNKSSSPFHNKSSCSVTELAFHWTIDSPSSSFCFLSRHKFRLTS